MKPHAIIFDLDGTLLDTLASIAGAFNQALTEMGHPTVEVHKFRHIIGNGARVSAQRCLPGSHQSQNDIEHCVSLFESHYEKEWDKAFPYEGMTETINQLAADVPLAVLSNKDEAFTSRCVDHFFPGKFMKVVGFSVDTPHKPDPTGGRSICEHLNVSPSDTWMVGDTATDMQTAIACDLIGVGVEWGFRDRDELVSNGARFVIQSPGDLITHYNNA